MVSTYWKIGKRIVEQEMKQLTKDFQNDKLEFIKNPVVAEFLGLNSNIDYTENTLEQSIITHIQKFLLEMGKGYAFVARQQHIRTELDDFSEPKAEWPWSPKQSFTAGAQPDGNVCRAELDEVEVA